MKFILFTASFEGYPIAYKMSQEGNDVTVGVIEDINDTLTSGEPTYHEKSDVTKKRLSNYDGLLKKIPADELIKQLKSLIKKDDYFIFFDTNEGWKYAEQLKGFKGNFPTETDRELEVNRQLGKDFVKEHYPNLKVKEIREFKKAKDGVAFLEETESVWVLKSMGDSGKTIVPETDDIETAKNEIVDFLTQETKVYEDGGFVLEEKIIDPVELTPEIAFYDGEPIYTTLDIENKYLGAGNIGRQVGCAQNLILVTEPEDKINKIAFPPIVFEMAKKRKGWFIWDASILIDKKGKMFFGEFCSNRPGYDSLQTQIAMAGDPDGEQIATPFFEAIIKGENPFKFSMGTSVRIFNLDLTKEGNLVENKIIQWNTDAEPDLWIFQMKKSKVFLEKEKIVNVGYDWSLAVITGVGNNLTEAVEKCYKYVSMFSFESAFYRPKFDFLSKSYPTSIVLRLKYALKNKLI